jgi:hypothetical protein
MRWITTKAALAALLIPFVSMPGAMGENLTSTTVFEGNATTPAKNGAPQSVHISVQSWGIAGQRGQNGIPYEIPLRGFYMAHLLSGEISTTIDGQTTKQPPGAYWTIKLGATMQVKVLGEYARLETTVVAKQ